MKAQAQTAARHEALQEDKEFVAGLSQKLHQTALFVVDADVQQHEIDDSSGCREITRTDPIPSQKFKRLIISEQHREEILKESRESDSLESSHTRRPRKAEEEESAAAVAQNAQSAQTAMKVEHVFVSTVSSVVAFSYKDKSSDNHTFDVEGVGVPDYQKALEKLADSRIGQIELPPELKESGTNTALRKEPIVTHMTRL